MGIKLAAQRVRITDFEGHNVALKFQGIVTNVATDFGTQDVVLARVVDLDGGVQGESLVFQQALARILRDERADWHVGKLTEQPNDKYEGGSLYVLADPEGLDLAQVEEALAKAGITA